MSRHYVELPQDEPQPKYTRESVRHYLTSSTPDHIDELIALFPFHMKPPYDDRVAPTLVKTRKSSNLVRTWHAIDYSQN